jgi:hypothetical protein
MRWHGPISTIELAAALLQPYSTGAFAPFERRISWKGLPAFARNSRRHARDHLQHYRRVRPPFRLTVQKDGRWPRAGAARERLVSSWRGQTLAARRHPSFPAMPCAAFELQHLLGLVNPIEQPSAI